MIDKDTNIKDGMTLKLQELLELQGKKDFDDAWRALPGIINQLVKFKKSTIALAQGYAANSGVKFAKEAWEKSWDVTDPVTPVGMIMRALRGKEFSKVCENPSLKQKYFRDECDKTIELEGQKATVVDVLKSAYATDSKWYWAGSDWRVPKKDAEGGWSNQTSVADSGTKYSLKNKGYKDGLVAEQCPQLGPSLNLLSMVNDIANKKVCGELMKAVFGEKVSDKRYWLSS
ncbi:hypothetical protein MHLP_03540 [Candidatus Mycoplasma haematolamae str. Purdue]|uniref:Uncharacterized protein n=1 Tax=Mycoplasma haematolamae (strain Purdue) TaxID=1212765 RepID=I7BK84_MYCHA|nr:hypothetical protein [Candidatus Mycoplasma haematolamae]AFO52276.1 hypothetical protein MHLP_03480 [Candidatus Mycoplasma haematolamae str. Purdue]AFO52288.1 hypothetical protein MHLP_03540 [Candidatus Mycoplasma haematolamae str. Purdue]